MIDALTDQECHADHDGDCNWEQCPQAVNYQVICPLWEEEDWQ